MSVETYGPLLREIQLRLERIHRDIAEIQSDILRLVGTPATEAAEAIGPMQDLQFGPAAIQADDSDDNDELPRECINPSAWLIAKKIGIKRVTPASGLDGAFDELALLLGDRFASLQPFYAAVKRRVTSSPGLRSINLTGCATHVRGEICTFASRLHANGFLSQFHYSKSSRTISFDPQPDGRVTNFFTGEWLERYVLLTAVKRAESRLPESVHPATLTRVVVELMDGQLAELDILLGLPDRVLWMECKTGNWQSHAKKFGRIGRCLGIPAEHAALVLLDPLSESEKRSASALSNMTVINADELEAFVESALAGAPPVAIAVKPAAAIRQNLVPAPESPDPSPAPALSVREEYARWLSKRGLRPLEPGHRRGVVQDLLRLADGQPVPLNELTKRLKSEYKSNGATISACQLNAVTTALRRAGLCERVPHPNYPHGVLVLRSRVTEDEILRRCSHLYLWTLLKNPAWPSARHLDPCQLASLLESSDVAKANPDGWLAELCQVLEAQGKLVREGTQYAAAGEWFEVVAAAGNGPPVDGAA